MNPRLSFVLRRPLLCLLLGSVLAAFPWVRARSAEIGGGDLDRIGRRIWMNECNGTVDGLTSWNSGENFASLGIGHFIWYPEGVDGPFEESFPKLVAWLRAEGVALPKWLSAARRCPWKDRAAFQRAHDSPEQQSLRKLLSATVREQTRFIMHRLDGAVAKFSEAAGGRGARVAARIAALRRTPEGTFALIDYVNFKGEGLNPRERYQGEGWGLLQVLLAMDGTGKSAAADFSEAAKRVLTRRVKNSPPERREERWLEGWKNRCESYKK